MKHIIDAHPLLWFLAGSPRLGAQSGSPRLGAQSGAVMRDAASELILPATAYAEACWIAEHGKVPPLTAQKIRDAIDADARFVICPLDRTVVERSQSPDLAVISEMHDRQIMATALVLMGAGEAVILLTRDANMTASALVPTLW